MRRMFLWVGHWCAHDGLHQCLLGLLQCTSCDFIRLRCGRHCLCHSRMRQALFVRPVQIGMRCQPGSMGVASFSMGTAAHLDQ
jgi:hypothetical protein